MSASRSVAARLGVLGLIWGTSFLWIKWMLEGLTPLGVAFSRCLLGVVVLLVVVAARRMELPTSPAVWGHFAVIALVANVWPFVAFAWAEQRVSSGLAGIYNATTPIMTLGIALVALPEERPTPGKLTGLLLGMFGVLVVLGPWRGVGAASLSGQLACLSAAVAYGIGFNYTRRKVTPLRLSPAVVTTGQLLIASVVLGVAIVASDQRPPHWSAKVVVATTVLGALGTGLAFLMYHAMIRDVGATSASTVTYLIPVVSVTLGVIALNEQVTWNLFAGAAVVILGVAISEGRVGWPGRAYTRPAAVSGD